MRAYYRYIGKRSLQNLGNTFKTQIAVGLMIALIAAAIAIGAGQGASSALYAVVATILYLIAAAGYFALREPAQLDWERELERRGLVEEVLAATVAPVPVEVSKLDDSQYEDFTFFRFRVRNVGNRKAMFRARVAELIGTDTTIGAEAPFELGWRHGNNKWAVEISPDDDEVWVDIGRMPRHSRHALDRVERERWGVAIFFRVLAREGEDAVEAAAPIRGIENADGLRQCNAYARITIRHVDSGAVVANKMARFYYDEFDGVLVPQMLLYDAQREVTD